MRAGYRELIIGMAKEMITGLVIREDQLEWTVLSTDKDRTQVGETRRVQVAGRPVLSPAGDEDVGMATQESAGGEAEDPLAEQVKKECRHLKSPISVCVSSDQLLTRVIKVPPVPDDEIPGMIRLQLDKISPFPVEEMVFSHELLTETPEERTILLAAVKEDVVDRLENTIGAAGLSSARVDIAVLGWWRLLKDARVVHEVGRHVMLVQDGSSIEMLVAQNGVPIEFRSLPKSDDWGGEIAEEISYTLMSQELEHGAGGTTLISIWHADPLPAALTQRLKDECLCDVVAKALSELPPLSEGIARRAIPADGPGIDLTPESWRQTEKARVFKRKLFLVAELLLAFWFFGVGVILGGVYYQQWLLGKLEDRKAEWDKPAEAVREMARRVRMINKYTQRTHSAIECLREVSVLLPTGLELTSFSYKKTESLKVSGKAGVVSQVYEFKKTLDKSRLFKDVSLEGPRFDRRSRRQIFDIEIKLPGGEQ